MDVIANTHRLMSDAIFSSDYFKKNYDKVYEAKGIPIEDTNKPAFEISEKSKKKIAKV